MSTVMYCWKLPKSELWNIVEEIRHFYREGYYYSVVDELSDKCEKDKDNNKFSDALKFLREIEEDYKCSLQLFDMGEDWLFRVLGQGYYFMNNWDKFDVTPVFYDNRTDIPLEHEPNEEIADWLDIQIRQRNYLVNPIVDYSILSEYMWKRAFNYAKQHKEEKSIENF